MELCENLTKLGAVSVVFMFLSHSDVWRVQGTCILRSQIWNSQLSNFQLAVPHACSSTPRYAKGRTTEVPSLEN